LLVKQRATASRRSRHKKMGYKFRNVDMVFCCVRYMNASCEYS
jgi:hypothetical protein